MIPANYDLSIYRGDTHTWRFALWVDAAKTQPLDLTGMQVKAEMRARTGSSPVTPLNLTVELPNAIHAILQPGQSRSLPSALFWDLQLTDPGGRVTTLLAGYVEVAGDITDSDAPPASEPALMHRRAGSLRDAPQ